MNKNNIKYNVTNNNNNSIKNQNLTSLPTINSSNNKRNLNRNYSVSKIFIFKKNFNGNTDDILHMFFTKEEIDLINNNIFNNDEKRLEEFKLKFYKINRSKEILNNKYNKENKKNKEKLKSAQEEIEYLNLKIRELEIKYQKLKSRNNEEIFKKRLTRNKTKNSENYLDRKDSIIKLGVIEENINNEKENIKENNAKKNENDDNNYISNQDSNNNNDDSKNKSDE